MFVTHRTLELGSLFHLLNLVQTTMRALDSVEFDTAHDRVLRSLRSLVDREPIRTQSMVIRRAGVWARTRAEQSGPGGVKLNRSSVLWCGLRPLNDGRMRHQTISSNLRDSSVSQNQLEADISALQSGAQNSKLPPVSAGGEWCPFS